MSLSFDQIPQQISTLIQEVAELKKLIIDQTKPESLPDWMNPDQLADYLPSNPAKQTIYGLVNRKKIPCHRINGKLFFKRDEIDFWIAGKRKSTEVEIEAKAKSFIEKNKSTK